MEHRRIGALHGSRIALGCGAFGTPGCDERAAEAVVQAALDAGITLFDTADIYGAGVSERVLGRALGRHRGEVVVATKFGKPMASDGRSQGGSARWVRSAVEGSLRRLGTDHIDLYQMHEPDPAVPLEETLAALGELVRAGKVLEVGLCNVDAAQVRHATGSDHAAVASVQNHYSVLTRRPEQGVLDACTEHQLAFLAFFPLEYGVLTGKYRRGEPPPAGTRLGNLDEEVRGWFLNDDVLDRVDALSRLADRWGHSLPELALAWVLAQEPVTAVLVGASHPDHVRANVRAAEWYLSADQLEDVDRACGLAARQ